MKIQETIYYDFQEEIDNDKIEEVVKAFKRGEIIAFPTETVYGLGGDAFNRKALLKIFEAKGRPNDNPLIIHVGCKKQIESLTEDISAIGEKLIEAFMPGPLTLVFKKKPEVPLEATGGLETVGVRIPDNEIMESILTKGNLFLAAPSANISGSPSPTRASHVKKDLDGKIFAIIDGGPTTVGLESTIVDLTGGVPVILRPGSITKEMLEGVVGEVLLDSYLLGGVEASVPKAPGMKYRHYAPKGELVIINPKTPGETLENYRNGRGILKKDVGLICFKEDIEDYRGLGFSSMINLGSREDLRKPLREFYQALREVDNQGLKLIFATRVEEEGLGFAFMNRLKKAAGGRFI